MQKELKNSGKTITAIICILAFGIGVLFNCYFQIVIVSGDSMKPTLSNGELIIIKKHSYKLDYNDIVVFNNGEMNVKRILALPYDKIKLINGSVLVNDITIRPYTYDRDDKSYVLSDDEYFVLGDNYLTSLDSRDYGPIQKSEIIGKVIFSSLFRDILHP